MMMHEKIIFLFFILFLSNTLLAGTVSTDITIDGYFESENHRDKLVCDEDYIGPSKNTFECTFFLKENIKKWTIDKNGFCFPFNLNQGEKPGEIVIDCGDRIEERFFYYLFDKKHTNWFLYKMSYSKKATGPEDAPLSIYTNPINQWSIDKELLKIKNVTTLSQLVTAVEKKYKKKKYTEIRAIAKTYPFTASDLTNQTVLNYNNLAFYYQQAGAHQQAIAILSDIVKQFPNRTVAYLNLGDAYLGQGNTQKARHYHQLYLNQMKAQGKECLIPKRLLQDVDSFE